MSFFISLFAGFLIMYLLIKTSRVEFPKSKEDLIKYHKKELKRLQNEK